MTRSSNLPLLPAPWPASPLRRVYVGVVSSSRGGLAVAAAAVTAAKRAQLRPAARHRGPHRTVLARRAASGRVRAPLPTSPCVVFAAATNFVTGQLPLVKSALSGLFPAIAFQWPCPTYTCAFPRIFSPADAAVTARSGLLRSTRRPPTARSSTRLSRLNESREGERAPLAAFARVLSPHCVQCQARLLRGRLLCGVRG